MSITYVRPGGDQGVNWKNSNNNQTDLYSYIDESSADDSDYVYSSNFFANGNGGGAFDNREQFALDNDATTPPANATVTVRIRARYVGPGSSGIGFRVAAHAAITPTSGSDYWSRKLGTPTSPGTDQVLTTSWATYSFTLTAGEVAAVPWGTGYNWSIFLYHTDWTDLFSAPADTLQVSWVVIEISVPDPPPPPPSPAPVTYSSAVQSPHQQALPTGPRPFIPVHPPKNVTYPKSRIVRPESATERAAREDISQDLGDLGTAQVFAALWSKLSSAERAEIAKLNSTELRAWMRNPKLPRIGRPQSPGSLMPGD